METVLIFIIVGLAAAYLLKKFSHSVRKTEESQCGCGCTSCPKDQACDEPHSRAVHHIK